MESQNQKLKNFLLKEIKAETVYSDLFPEWKKDNNVSCPFAEIKHNKGTDTKPSMSIDLEKGVYCHSCGYMASSFIGLYEDLHSIQFEVAMKELYSNYIRPIVPVRDYKKPAKQLLGNPLILSRIFKIRGLDKSTIKKWRLGWYGDRLYIPIFNEFGFCVNIRKHDIFGRFTDKFAKIVSYGKKNEGYGEACLYPMESLRGNIVYLCEGELDTLLMIQHGFSAVTATGGALTWEDSWNRYFKNKKVVIVPDNDSTGMRGANKKLQSLEKVAETRILKLPVHEEREDITDWFLKYNGTSGKLRELSRELFKDTASKEKEKEETETVYTDSPDLLAETLTPKDRLMIDRACIIYNELTNEGAFFKNFSNSLFFVKGNGKVLQVGMSSLEYLSYMSRLSPLINTATSNGRFILQHVVNKGYSDSKLVKSGTWSLLNKGILYIYEKGNNIIRLAEDSTSRVPNAINNESVLLEYPYPQMSFTFSGKTSIDGGVKTLWHSFAENLALNNSDRLLLLCWLLGIFFRDYVQARPLIRLLAKTAWGKSTASKMISLLLYGDELLSHSASTLAASYEMSRTHPLLIFDNIETRNMTQSFEDFLLIVATGGLKAKRQKLSDTGIIMDSSNCLLMTNGIEPFNKRELISRTIELNLDLDQYGKFPFHEVKVYQQIISERSNILSAILKLLRNDILPKLNSGEIGKISSSLKHHSKERFNTYIAVMVAILESMWPFLPLEAKEFSFEDTIDKWLRSQDISTAIQDSQTNDVLYFMFTFIERHSLIPEFRVQLSENVERIKFKATTRELLSDFRILARHLGMRCPWNNERQLGMRLLDASDILLENGCKRTKKILAGKMMYEYVFKKGLKNDSRRKKKKGVVF